MGKHHCVTVKGLFRVDFGWVDFTFFIFHVLFCVRAVLSNSLLKVSIVGTLQ